MPHMNQNSQRCPWLCVDTRSGPNIGMCCDFLVWLKKQCGCASEVYFRLANKKRRTALYTAVCICFKCVKLILNKKLNCSCRGKTAPLVIQNWRTFICSLKWPWRQKGSVLWRMFRLHANFCQPWIIPTARLALCSHSGQNGNMKRTKNHTLYLVSGCVYILIYRIFKTPLVLYMFSFTFTFTWKNWN